MGSLPEVMCPVFFYSLVCGLLWQGFILVKSLWKEICMVLDAWSWTWRNCSELEWLLFVQVRLWKSHKYSVRQLLQRVQSGGQSGWAGICIGHPMDIVEASWVWAVGSSGVKSGGSGRLPGSESCFHLSMARCYHGQDTELFAPQFLPCKVRMIDSTCLMIILLWMC